ncbi:phosphotransferase family protein [Qipengyuania xiapuensis]|uniref:Phosphotransferase family protein n=1 Tax=Qipengyuania xiapuensis TaxID=2867236 RepID=A0ABX8ZYB5_9SPHN|nr:phosphotransferase [Qipengyuania xiapuensis]QZD93079.1 phosphotransferase family protein [Qipengyuania xiapuensis]
MGESEGDSLLKDGLAKALARAGLPTPDALRRLTGGATMESWRFVSGGEDFVLRRAPSPAFMEERPYGHDTEAAIIRAAREQGVTAPEVIAELEPADGIGSGFIMRALPGTPDPRAILAMEDPAQLLREAARDLALIHCIAPSDLPSDIPTLDYAEGVGKLREQFEDAGGDRPIIALGLRWLMDNLPNPVEPVLNHGDYRLGNILCEDSHLTGVLDWELAHFGDPHEDLAFGCMPVWRFGAYACPALGFGSLDDYFAAYEENGGGKVDPARFRFWTIYRTVWWALGCLRNAQMWRSGDDRMLERVVISRRTSEQELDLLLLLEEDVPEELRSSRLENIDAELVYRHVEKGEATPGEIATAVSEWLAQIKDKVSGHDRFQLAVARNALGMIARGDDWGRLAIVDRELCDEIFAGNVTLESGDLLNEMRLAALDKVEADVPKYPSLAVARSKWLGDN